MDVVGLYPHIPHEEGLEALKKALDKSDAILPVDELVSLAKVILENNYCELDEKRFRQKLGTAIGTISSLRVMKIFLWVILRRNFWIAVNLSPGYGGDFWMMYIYILAIDEGRAHKFKGMNLRDITLEGNIF
jgi:hypothetical protein